MNPSTAADPGLGGKAKLRGIETDLQNLLVEILKKNGEDVDAGSRDNIIGLQWSGLGKKHGGKTKSVIIKDYIVSTSTNVRCKKTMELHRAI